METAAGHIAGPWKFRPRDWKNILKRSRQRVALDNLGFVAAGVAFYIFLGIFPLLAVFVSLYGLAASPEDVIALMNETKAFVPGEITSIFEQQLKRLAQRNQVAGLAALFSVFAAIWAGSKAIKGMMSALNIAYNESETRGLLKKNGLALLLTFGGVITGAICVFLLAGLPVLSNLFGWLRGWPMQIIRWTFLAVVIITALSILYRWAPDRKKVKWRWITPGSTAASILWLLSSGLFSWYVSNFANYNKTYGSLGAIAIFMLWLALSSFFFLLGAELDSEMERQAGMLKKDNRRRKVT